MKKPRDAKKSQRPNALLVGMRMLLLNFLCSYISSCKNSCHLLWSELCISVVPAISGAITVLNQWEDLVFSLILLRSCFILMQTQFRHLVACCKIALLTLIIDLYGCCEFFSQKLRLPVVHLIEGCATLLIQWQELVLLLFSLFCFEKPKNTIRTN